MNPMTHAGGVQVPRWDDQGVGSAGLLSSSPAEPTPCRACSVGHPDAHQKGAAAWWRWLCSAGDVSRQQPSARSVG